MIRIDRLRIKLPNSMQQQATSFTDHLAEALSLLEFSKSVKLESVVLPTIKVAGDQSMNETAIQVANQIHHYIEGEMK